MAEKIEIVTALIDKVSGKAKRITESIQTMDKGIQTTITSTHKYTAAGYKMEKQNTKMVTGLHKFKFEWLSVMFAGMALSRVFGGMVRTQMELFGVTEMYGATLMLVMLPVMEAITPILVLFLEYFMNLPPAIKFAIGAFIILVAIIGGIALVVGQVMLAVNGLAILFGVTGAAILGTIGLVIAAIIGIGLVVIGIYMIVKGKMEGIGLVIMGVGAILLLFIGWWALIPIAVGAAVYLIIKHWDWLKKKWWDTINYIKSIIPSWLLTLFKYTTPFGIGIMSMAGFQAGGIIPATGPYMLHKGETVIPAGEGAFAPTINITASVASDYDVRILADRINEYLAPKYEAMMKGRGSI